MANFEILLLYILIVSMHALHLIWFRNVLRLSVNDVVKKAMNTYQQLMLIVFASFHLVEAWPPKEENRAWFYVVPVIVHVVFTIVMSMVTNKPAAPEVALSPNNNDGNTSFQYLMQQARWWSIFIISICYFIGMGFLAEDTSIWLWVLMLDNCVEFSVLLWVFKEFAKASSGSDDFVTMGYRLDILSQNVVGKKLILCLVVSLPPTYGIMVLVLSVIFHWAYILVKFFRAARITPAEIENAHVPQPQGVVGQQEDNIPGSSLEENTTADLNEVVVE